MSGLSEAAADDVGHDGSAFSRWDWQIDTADWIRSALRCNWCLVELAGWERPPPLAQSTSSLVSLLLLLRPCWIGFSRNLLPFTVLHYNHARWLSAHTVYRTYHIVSGWPTQIQPRINKLSIYYPRAAFPACDRAVTVTHVGSSVWKIGLNQSNAKIMFSFTLSLRIALVLPL